MRYSNIFSKIISGSKQRVFPPKKKCLENDYLRCDLDGFHLTVFKERAETEFLTLCCKGPSSDNTGFSKVSSSDYTKVYSFEYMGQQYYYKVFLHRNRLEPIKIFFHKSRAERALRGFFLLHENGFHTPRVVVVGKKAQFNFMVSEAVTNPSVLQNYFQKKSEPPFSREKIAKKRTAIVRLGHTIGKLHSLGICHGDLRWGNLMVDSSDSILMCYAFLDNERTKRYNLLLPDRKRLKNLVQLNMIYDTIIVSHTDRLRFFHAYLISNPQLIPQKKKWIRRITTATARRIAQRNIRKNSIYP